MNIRPMAFVRQRWMRWVGCLVLVALGGWWWQHTHTFHLAKRIAVTDWTLMPRVDGFMIREQDRAFVYRAWDGRERWRVAGAGSVAFEALSPNGRYLVTGEAGRVDGRLRIWQDGRLIDERATRIPADETSVKALDDGRVFYWDAASGRAVLVHNRHEVAKGRLWPRSLMAPDASAVVSTVRPSHPNSRYATVAVANGKITLRAPYTIPTPLASSFYEETLGLETLFQGGHVLTDDGAVYGPKGRISGPTGLNHGDNAPGGRFLLQDDGEHTARVFSPVTGEHWSMRVSGTPDSGDATADGQYALVYYTHTMPPAAQKFMALLTRVRLAPQSAAYGSGELEYVAMYRRPGRFCARMLFDPSRWTRSGYDIFSRAWYPATDGRGLVLVGENDHGGECLIFRR